MSEENNPNYLGLAQLSTTTLQSYNVITRLTYENFGPEAAKNVDGLVGAYKFFDGAVYNAFLPGVSIAAAYASADQDVVLRKTINASVNEVISIGVEAAYASGVGRVVGILVGTGTNLHLNKAEIDFYGYATHLGSFLGVSTSNYYYVKEYQRGDTSFYEGYDSGNQELHFTTEGYDSTNYTTLKLSSNNDVTRVTRHDDGNTLEIDLRTKEWTLTTPSGETSGSLLEDTMDAASEAIITDIYNTLKAELQLRDPNINLDPLDQTVTNIVEHDAVLIASDAEKHSVSWGNNYFYKNISQGISGLSNGDVSLISDEALGNTFIQLKDSDTGYISMVGHDGVTGLNTLYYADPLNDGALTTIFVSDPSQLSAAQQAVYFATINAGNQLLIEAGKEIIQAAPSLNGNFSQLFGGDSVEQELNSIAEAGRTNVTDSSGNRDVSDPSDLETLPDTTDGMSYQNQGIGIDLIPLTDADRVELIVKGSDAVADTRQSQFWTLYNKAISEGTLSTLQDGSNVRTLASGVSLRTIQQSDGKSLNILEAGGNTVGVHTTFEGGYQSEVLELFNDDNGSNSNLVYITTTDTVNGISYDTNTIELKYPETFVYSEVGGYVGNLVGQQLADGNAFKNIAYTSVLKTLGQHGGTLLDFLAADNAVGNSLNIAKNGADVSGLGDLQDRPDIFSNFAKNFTNVLASTIANELVGEFAEAIDLDGFGGEIVSSVGTAVTTQLVNEAFDVVFEGLDGAVFESIADGEFFEDGLQIDFASLIIKFAASKAANAVIEPEDQVAGILGTIGAAYGAAVGAASATAGSLTFVSINTALTTASSATKAILAGSFAGPIGIAVGAFIGTIAGTLLGNAFGGEEPSSFANVEFHEPTGGYALGQTWTKDGGPTHLSRSMAESVSQGVNSVIEASGGTLRHTATPPQLTVGWRDDKFYVKIVDGETRTFGSAGDAVEFASLHLLKSYDLVGGHAIAMRAWHNSDAESLSEWQQDMEVAEAFQNYLLDPTGILALMMNEPESTLAQSWAAILQRAAELELHLPHEKDLDGGWNELLLARGDIDPSLIPDIQGNDIVLTDPITGEETVLHHVIGPGYEIVRIEGTDGNDIIEVMVDGPSITYVDAGAGDDTIEGSEERDIILGGSGDDVINGNAGDDWINGGSGDDIVHGNGGLDLLYGGDDNDQLFGDEDNDALYGGLGDDELFGLAGNDELFGGAGNDILHGMEGNNTLYGGEGDDTFNSDYYDYAYGGKGNDTFNALGGGVITINRDEGHDVVNGNATTHTVINFGPDISVNELWFEAQGHDMLIRILGENQTVLVKDIFDTSNPHLYAFEANGHFRISGQEIGLHDSNSFLWLEAHLNTTHTGLGTWTAPVGDYNEIPESSLLLKAAAYENWFAQGEIPNILLNPFHQASGWDSSHTNDPLFVGTTDENAFVIPAGGGYGGVHIYGGLLSDTITVPHGHSHETFDYLYGDHGADNLDGGYGNDIIIGGFGDDDIWANRGADVIWGGFGNDEIYAHEGNDTVYGGFGDDLIVGDYGHDLLYGGEGHDEIRDLSGNNEIYGDGGDDAITINGAGDNYLDGGDGHDTITALNGNDTVIGGAGDDILSAGSGDDSVEGGEGHDTYYYSSGHDTIIEVGAGLDTIIFDASWDLDDVIVENNVLSFDGNTTDSITFNNITLIETFRFDGHADLTAQDMLTLRDDTFVGTLAVEAFDGEDGVDTVDYSAATGRVTVRLDNGTGTHNEAAGDTYVNIENVIGSEHAFDALYGNDADNHLQGLGGSDRLYGSFGADIMDGGGNTDTVFYSSSNEAITVDLSSSAAQVGGHAEGDILISIEHTYGSNHDDTIYGTDGYNRIYGKNGNDLIDGQAGNDILYGEAGNDTLTGGAGDDDLYGGAGDDTAIFSGNYAAYVITDNSGALTVQDTIGTDGTDDLTDIERLVFANGIFENGIFTSTAANSVPIAASDSVSIDQDQSVTVDVLANDSDPDSDVLSVSIAVAAVSGTAVVNADNTVTYTPNAGFYGSDSFTYSVDDGHGGTASATVNITVNEVVSSDDTFVGTLTAEAFDGGDGVDTVDYSAATGRVTVRLDNGTGTHNEAAGDTYVNIENVIGSEHAFDALYGNDADNHLQGLGGSDRLYGSLGADIMDGGGNTDEVFYNSSNAAVTIDLASSAPQVGGYAEGDTLISIEHAYGSNHDDTIYGTDGYNRLYGKNGDDVLYGRDGDDRLYGDAGDDVIYGGAGIDLLYGNAGADTFVFEAAGAFTHSDNVQDFSLADGDKIDISDVLQGYDQVTDSIADFVQITDNGTHSYLSVDADGGADNFVQIAAIFNITGLTDEDALETNGTLVTA